MQAKHVWTFYLRSMKPLAQRVIAWELVMNGHLIAKKSAAELFWLSQSGLFSWTELALDFKLLCVSLRGLPSVVLLNQ